MSGDVTIRRLERDDAEAAVAVLEAAVADREQRCGRPPPAPTEERRLQLARTFRRFSRTDPDGALLAVAHSQPIGVATAIRRGTFWGLSTLFVRPEWQGRRVGAALLRWALAYADGADACLIQSSDDPRAVRGYAGAGFRLHPTVFASGTVDTRALGTHAGERARQGNADDLRVVEDVDRQVRGLCRSADVEWLLGEGARLTVYEAGASLAYAVWREGSSPVDGYPILACATDEEAGSATLAAVLRDARDPVRLNALTAGHSWAIDVALRARLEIQPGPPLMARGVSEPARLALVSGFWF